MAKIDILDERRLPAVIHSEQAAELLGVSEDQIGILTALKHLEALGHPKRNSVKLFSSDEIIEHSENPEWLSQAVTKLYGRSRGRKSQKEARDKAKDQSGVGAVAQAT